MKVSLDVFVIWNGDNSWGREPKFEAWMCDVSSSDPKYALACKTVVEVEIPDDFDPVPKQIETLKEHKQKILAQAQVEAQNIEEQIQRLLCIEYKPEAK